MNVNIVNDKLHTTIIEKPTVTSAISPSWKTVLEEWKGGKVDASMLSLIKKQPCYFEVSPLYKNQESSFMYKIIPTSFIADADPSKFKTYINEITEDTVTFYNLNRDSLLVSPTDTSKNYAHLQVFLNNASNKEVTSFFRAWAEAAESLLDKVDVVWLSTHGNSVPWLHGRVDPRPKYYQTKEFIGT
jgi:hypothetical protein